MNVLETALISVSVSVVVTLLVEWLAKPTLEARKERILKRQQALQDTLATAKEESWRLEISILEREEVYKPELRREFLAARSRVPHILNKRNREALQKITDIMVRQVQASDPTDIQSETRAMDEALVLFLAAALIETPAWRFRKRKKIYTDFIIEVGLAPH